MARDALSLPARFVMFGAAWLLLTKGSLANWPLAAAVVFLASVASLQLLPPGTWRWRLAGMLRFAPFFLFESLAGGIDVARRALGPGSSVEPVMLEYALRLPEGPARRFFAAAVGLLPGTLTAHQRADRLIVHALDANMAVEATLRRLEIRTADLFGLPRF